LNTQHAIHHQNKHCNRAQNGQHRFSRFSHSKFGRLSTTFFPSPEMHRKKARQTTNNTCTKARDPIVDRKRDSPSIDTQSTAKVEQAQTTRNHFPVISHASCTTRSDAPTTRPTPHTNPLRRACAHSQTHKQPTNTGLIALISD
jgi:hypothetical protein